MKCPRTIFAHQTKMTIWALICTIKTNKQMKNNYILIYFLLLIIILFVIANSCKKDDDESVNLNPIQSNEIVKTALAQAGITTFDGNTPPVLEGQYTTMHMQTYNAFGNLTFLIGQNLNSVFKLYNQTQEGSLSFSEKLPSGLWASGNGGYITGSDNNFTIWMENSLSNGAATEFILSATIDYSTGNFLNCKCITVFTKASSSYNVGDWYASSGWSEKTTQLCVYTMMSTFPCISSAGIAIYINDEYKGSLTQYFTSTPDCGGSGTITCDVLSGTYKFFAKCNSGSTVWGPYMYTAVSGICNKLRLDNKK